MISSCVTAPAPAPPPAALQVRMELTHVRELLDGMSQDAYRRMQDEDVKLKQRVASLTLELQAARDKLAVYQRTSFMGGDTAGDGGDDGACVRAWEGGVGGAPSRSRWRWR